MTEGTKYDHGKPMMGLLLKDFASALSVVGDVTTFGAAKYAPSNWLKVEDAERRYLDAMCRHLFADLRGIENDDESGKPHLAHAAWCLLAVLELRQRAGQ